MSKAMREAFGEHLRELGASHPEIVVLDADVSASTKSSLFGKAYPERFFNVGVAEGDMAGIAAGLATAGFHPVINTFSVFMTLKSIDQIRHDIAYNRLPVVIAAAYGGLSDSFDGSSHQAVEDIGVFRMMPNLEVIVPSDALQAELALDYAIEHKGPVVIRLNRNEMPDIKTDREDFFNAKAVKITEGSDLTIACSGITASMGEEAAKMLIGDGVSAEVLSVPFIKPLDTKTIFSSVEKTRHLLTVEEHLLAGGFASAIAEKAFPMQLRCRVANIAIEDTFGETGPYIPLLEKYGLSAVNIYETAKRLISK